MIRQELLTPVEPEPVTLAEAKLHMRVDHFEEDVLIAAAVSASRQESEHMTGRRWGTQTWRQTFATVASQELQELGRVASVTVQVRLPDGQWQSVPTEQFELVQSVPARVRLLPAFVPPEPVDYEEVMRIDAVCGEPLPGPVRSWILLRTGDKYEHRESVVAVTRGALQVLPYADSLLDPYRVWRL